MSTSLQLYVIGGLEILIPVIALMVLRRAHKYRISTIICGIGGYFLAVNILMAFASMMLASIGMDQAFWEKHALLSEITNIILNVNFPRSDTICYYAVCSESEYTNLRRDFPRNFILVGRGHDSLYECCQPMPGRFHVG